MVSKLDKNGTGKQSAGAERARADVRRCVLQIRALVVDYRNKLMAAGDLRTGAARPDFGPHPHRPPDSSDS